MALAAISGANRLGDSGLTGTERVHNEATRMARGLLLFLSAEKDTRHAQITNALRADSGRRGPQDRPARRLHNAADATPQPGCRAERDEDRAVQPAVRPAVPPFDPPPVDTASYGNHGTGSPR